MTTVNELPHLPPRIRCVCSTFAALAALAVVSPTTHAATLDTYSIGSVASYDAIGDSSNVTLVYTYAGPKATLTQLVIPGPFTLSKGAYGYGKDAHILVTTTGGFSLDIQPTTKGSYSGTYTEYNTKTASLTTPISINHGQQFSFQFYENYDDSNNAVDQTWGALTIRFEGNVFGPPASKSVTVGSTNSDIIVGQQVLWYKLDVTTAGAYIIDTAGTFITTINGRENDTQLAIYDADGLLLESNDDVSSGLYTSRIQRTLDVGSYYLAAGGTPITFADDFIASSTSIQTGNLHLNIHPAPEPASLSLLLCGAMGLLRRQRA